MTTPTAASNHSTVVFRCLVPPSPRRTLLPDELCGIRAQNWAADVSCEISALPTEAADTGQTALHGSATAPVCTCGRLGSAVTNSDNAGFAQTAVVQVTSRGPEPDPAAQTPADRRPRRTVLTFGCFDLFHFGHLRYLQRAAALGDRLVVGLTSDPVRWSTSRKVPTVCQQQRVDIVRAIKGVDQVFLNFADYKGDGKLRHIMEHFFERYGIDVFVAGDEPSVRRAYAAACLEDFVELVYLPRTAGVSSTELKLKLGGGAPAPAEAPQEASPAEVAAGSLLSGVTTASEIAEWDGCINRSEILRPGTGTEGRFAACFGDGVAEAGRGGRSANQRTARRRRQESQTRARHRTPS